MGYFLISVGITTNAWKKGVIVQDPGVFTPTDIYFHIPEDDGEYIISSGEMDLFAKQYLVPNALIRIILYRGDIKTLIRGDNKKVFNYCTNIRICWD